MFRALPLLLLMGSVALAEDVDRRQVTPLSPELQSRCLAVLREALKSGEFWPAMHAAEALTLAGRGEEVRAALYPLLETDADPQHRCGLIREIVRTGDRKPLDEMFRILGDQQSQGRVHAAESLYKVNETADGRLLREAFAQSENLRLRLMAAAALGRQGDAAAMKTLRQHLTHDDVEIRKIAVWVLGLLGDSSDVTPLQTQFAKETDPLARAYYVNALACLNDDAARRQLVQNLSSEDAAIRTYSAEFAGYSRTVEARPRLIELLSDSNVDVRARAAQTLIAFSLPRAALKLPKR
jgi:sialidase-1